MKSLIFVAKSLQANNIDGSSEKCNGHLPRMRLNFKLQTLRPFVIGMRVESGQVNAKKLTEFKFKIKMIFIFSGT